MHKGGNQPRDMHPGDTQFFFAQIGKNHAHVKNGQPGDRNDEFLSAPKGDRAKDQKQQKQKLLPRRGPLNDDRKVRCQKIEKKQRADVPVEFRSQTGEVLKGKQIADGHLKGKITCNILIKQPYQNKNRIGRKQPLHATLHKISDIGVGA